MRPFVIPIDLHTKKVYRFSMSFFSKTAYWIFPSMSRSTVLCTCRSFFSIIPLPFILRYRSLYCSNVKKNADTFVYNRYSQSIFFWKVKTIFLPSRSQSANQKFFTCRRPFKNNLVMVFSTVC